MEISRSNKLNLGQDTKQAHTFMLMFHVYSIQKAETKLENWHYWLTLAVSRLSKWVLYKYK